MPPALTEPLASLTQRWNALPRGIRVLLIAGTVLGLLAGVGVYAVNTLFDDQQVLFSNLSPEDAGAVVEALRTGHVAYRVGDGGQVLVPASRVHEWRMRLASQGIPAGGNVGFEIFDKNQFGLTDFSQRLNFQRALQGELARTIGQLREVQQARVHLAIPAPRVFSSQDKPPSASIVLRLRPGGTLRPEQVRGIVHLVTAAVEGLSPERVTVVDTSGRVLASGQEQRPGGLAASQTEAQGTIEQDTERRIQGLLDPIVGAGRSAVRVSALVNFDQIERTEERFDPKPLVRSQSKTTENTQGSSSQPTLVGAGDKAQVQSSSSTNKIQRDSEQTAYEIARTVEKTVVAPGDVRRLSVAVLLDVPSVNGTRTPRPDEEIEGIKRLVASAAGIRADRKDELEVLQVPFDPGIAAPGEGSTPAASQAPSRRVPVWVWAAAGAFALVVIGLAAVLLMARSRRRRAALEAVKAAMEAGELPIGPAAAGANGSASAPAPVSPLDLTRKLTAEDELRERVLAAARQHPDEMAQVIRAWMFKRRTTAS